MPNQIKAALSAGAHALVVFLISVLVAHGIDLPTSWTMPIQIAILGAAVTAYAALTHWLSNRSTTSWWGRASVWLSKVLTLGTGALTAAKPRIDPVVASVAPRRT